MLWQFIRNTLLCDLRKKAAKFYIFLFCFPGIIFSLLKLKCLFHNQGSSAITVSVIIIHIT